MDTTDIKILEILQTDGRISMKELGNLVALSPPAVSERVKRLEESGIIKGYAAVVDPKLLGKRVFAIINVQMMVNQHRAFLQLVNNDPAIVECHHLTGEDCMTIKVLLSDTIELEKLLDRIQQLGNTRTTIVLSSPLDRKPILP
ncbi:Lrp/AsnC family transcriptional regulator [Acidaminobacter hydrogenoformans]|uniref:Lrp/AsnC family transcriptional regulator, leucine-responsive regulatory protein n=1 Tax=Acidaminobacter hydrogenoformans DSM 2784 TaxID=1120920 RepID=A0A1G5RTE3_9FIRM|nr:Lrp/AsnC family transcriptional regulator [Acidaminobacter hydrogenoformans]SCZ77108.1 Lrp/AsnC family transcriptional regulator, leucine-responsive regulatory protein [Acidaminobacter hydrogenoformans DSM 2784]